MLANPTTYVKWCSGRSLETAVNDQHLAGCCRHLRTSPPALKETVLSILLHVNPDELGGQGEGSLIRHSRKRHRRRARQRHHRNWRLRKASGNPINIAESFNAPSFAGAITTDGEGAP